MNNWLLAARLKTLPAAISPVLLGSALSYHNGRFEIITLYMTLIAAILIQVGTNLANDVYDYQKGSDRNDRLGPIRVTQAGLIHPRIVKIAMCIVFGLAVCVGFYLAMIGGWPIVIIGIASIIAGICYTGGPYPLGYNGLGDIFVFLFFGIIAVSGTYYLHIGKVDTICLWMGVTMGSLSNAILVVNNLRDIDTDKLSGKKTLAVRLGKKLTKIQYSILVIIPYFIPIYMWWNYENEMSLLLTLFSFPISIYLINDIHVLTGKNLNQLLNRTSRFLFLFTLLLSIGLIL